MGNCFKTQNKLYNSSLSMPLNNDPYASINLYNNLDFNNLLDRIEQLEKKIDFCENNIITLEENTQNNLKLLSKDIHHINNNLNIKPPVVI